MSSVGKRIHPEWTRTLSETALDIKVLVEPGNVSSLLVLTTHHFMCYKDSGILKFMKKLEYNPSCFMVYYNEKNMFVCVASHTSNLLVYKETELKWACRLPFVPVCMDRADFKGIDKSLVILGEAGQLHVCYLGTDPSLFVAPPIESREINYDQNDQELAQLNKVIRSSSKDQVAFMNISRGERNVLVSTTVGNQLEAWPGITNVNDPDGVPAVSVIVRLTAYVPVSAVRVNIQVKKPLAVTQNTFMLRTVCDTSQILLKFYLSEPYVPSSLQVIIITSYISSSGAPHVLINHVDLPLRLVVKPSVPNKEADFKITVSTNKSAVNLSELFPEFGLDGNISTALGLQYYGGANVTVLSSRTTNRYRLQSDSLAALWLILKTLSKRLEKYWNVDNKGDENVILGATSPVPVHDLFAAIDDHFLRRKKHKDLENELLQRAIQFRAIQKRLLTKFKDKTLTPLKNLEKLLEGTFKQILDITDTINTNIKGMEEAASSLSCILRLVLEMLFLYSNLEDDQKNLLMGALSPIVSPSMEQGWEDVADATVTFLLRSLLGKSTKDAGNFPPNLSMPSDTNKLKKHIGLLVDKILKGGSVHILDDKSIAEEDHANYDEMKKEKDTDDDDYFLPSRRDAPSYKNLEQLTQVPVGSRLGEDRARSARIRSARTGGGLATIKEDKIPLQEGPIEESLPTEENNSSSDAASNVIPAPNKYQKEMMNISKSSSLEALKMSLSTENVIEAPTDVLSNTIEEETW